MTLVKSQERRDKSQKARIASRSAASSPRLSLDSRLSPRGFTSYVGEFLRNSHSRPPRRTRLRIGFTLIEMLVVILIIAILASLILGVAAIAAETAKENSTRHTIERLHTLLTEYYGTFKTRRVNVTSGVTQAIARSSLSTAAAKSQATAEARAYALRELMMMEMPDRWSDVLLTSVGTAGKGADDTAAPTPVTAAGLPLYLGDPNSAANRTELANIYLRRYGNLVGRVNTITGVANTAGDIKANQSAECLYMIVTLACGEGEARAQFGESSIGDTDGDGAPEFLDGWGHPISFLRCAPGFVSQIELNANDLNQLQPAALTTAIAKDHDPFDVFRVDSTAFRLVPLIYSGGRDESTGLFDAPGSVTWLPNGNSLQVKNAAQPPYLSPAPSPYQKVSWTDPTNNNSYSAFLGTSMHVVDANSYDETSTDNVHNHLMGQR